MLIVEGPDCVGKTSFAKRCVDRARAVGLPAMYRHFGLLPDCWLYPQSYYPSITKYEVMDRFIMSELVYGNVVRKGSKIGPESYRLLDARLRLAGSFTVVIMCMNNDVMGAKYDDSLCEHAFGREQVLAINDVYAKVIMAKQGADVDMSIILNAPNDWPSEEHVIRTVSAWHARLAEVVNVAT